MPAYEEPEELLFFGQLLKDCSILHLLKQIVIHSSQPILFTAPLNANGQYPIVYANKSFLTHVGYEIAEVLGRSPSMFQGPLSDFQMLGKLKQTLEQHQSFSGISTNYRKDGSHYRVQWSISPIKDDRGNTILYMSVQSDLDEAMPPPVDTVSTDVAVDPTTAFTEFFDLEWPDDKGSAPVSEVKQAMSAAEFLQDDSVDDDDIQSVLESIKALDIELSLLNSEILCPSAMASVASCFNNVSTALSYLVVFQQGAQTIMDVANKVAGLSECKALTVPLLIDFNAEIQAWLEASFVSKSAVNVFEGEANLVGTGKQLLASL